MNLQPLLDQLTRYEQQTTARAEHLRAQIEDLAVQLRETEQELEHLLITRKTVLALPNEELAPPATPPDLPEHPDYQRILAVFADQRRPLRARDLCEALDTGFEPKRIEGVRSKLKRLVKRGILEEPEAGVFRPVRP